MSAVVTPGQATTPMPRPAPSDPAECFFFGAPERQLFGAFHPAQGPAGKATAVLLCYPSGRDYIFTHRTFRRLALGLSRAGLAVLRFDYFGCGDSAGDSDQGSIPQWSADIDLAMQELKARSGASQVCLVGFRLGASLAALAGARQGRLERMVLWDPIVNGQQHLQRRLELHARWASRQTWGPRLAASARPQTESLGFPLSSALQADKRRLDLLALASRPADQVLLLTSSGQPEDLDPCRARLEQLGAAVDPRQLDWPEFWSGGEALADVLMPPVPILQAIVAWVSGACR